MIDIKFGAVPDSLSSKYLALQIPTTEEIENAYIDNEARTNPQTRVGLSRAAQTGLSIEGLKNDEAEAEAREQVASDKPFGTIEDVSGPKPPILKTYKFVGILNTKTRKFVNLESYSQFNGRIKSIEYSEERDRIHSAAILIEDKGGRILNSTKLSKPIWPGTGVSITIGWTHKYRTVIVGRIVKNEPIFSEDGHRYIRVRCYDDRLRYKWEEPKKIKLDANADNPVQLMMSIVKEMSTSEGRAAYQLELMRLYKKDGLKKFFGVKQTEIIKKFDEVLYSQDQSILTTDAKYVYNILGGDTAFKAASSCVSTTDTTSLQLMAYAFIALGSDMSSFEGKLVALNALSLPAPSLTITYGKELKSMDITNEDMANWIPQPKIYQDKETLGLDKNAWIFDALRNAGKDSINSSLVRFVNG